MEIVLSGVIKNFTLKENMFDRAGRLACRALWLLFLLEYKRVCKSAVTNTLLLLVLFVIFGKLEAILPKRV